MATIRAVLLRRGEVAVPLAQYDAAADGGAPHWIVVPSPFPIMAARGPGSAPLMRTPADVYWLPLRERGRARLVYFYLFVGRLPQWP